MLGSNDRAPTMQTCRPTTPEPDFHGLRGGSDPGGGGSGAGVAALDRGGPMRVALLAAALVALASCARGPGGARPADGPGPATPGGSPEKAGKIGPVARPGTPLDVAGAQAYALSLINHDRAAAGLSPVVLDPTATAAAARHVRDMVAHGYTAHWGTDGSVPEMRYTEAGGEDITTENVACFGDAIERKPDTDGPFDAAEIERFQAAFMGEVPPNDGHRKNILQPLHNRVGLAFATSPGTKTVCVAQEFIDDYGSYGAIPQRAKAGDTLKVTGEVRAPASFGGIGLARVPLPKPRTARELLQTGGYQMPSPFVAYFPRGYKTPKPVEVTGNSFSLELPLEKLQGPGLYHVQVFAKFPGGGSELVPISLRTVLIP
jgi:uncharacterized protein YkwD